MEMKKLYALLVILIVIYVGINVIPWGGTDSQSVENVTVDENLITVGASSFPQIENFKDSVVNDTTTSLADSSKDMTIYVSEIDNSQNIKDIFTNFEASSESTSDQTIDQNGVTTYFVYNEGEGSYSAHIFFNKNGQNYMINGDNINYDNSDYFINHCKNIIDTIDINSIS